MKSYTIGFMVVGVGLIFALALWVVGYVVLPNADTHRQLANNPPIQTSATNNSSSSTPSGTGSSGGSTATTQLYTLGSTPHTVNLTIQAGDASVASGMNFNGFNNGQLVITVPVGWKVNVAFQDLDANVPHSVGFVPWAQHLDSNATAAFPGSLGPSFNAGMTATDGIKKFSFTAATAGQYGMICGVPGHAASGMWDAFDVSNTVKAPTVKTPSGTNPVQ